MKRLTVAEKLHSRRITPPGIMYHILGWFWKTFIAKKYNVHINDNVGMSKVEGSYIFISNHASRLDYIFTGIPVFPKKMNYVAGYNEFHRLHLSLVFRLLHVIPKKNFVPDIYSIKEIFRVLKAGGRICIFPEGMSSISGANQPIAIGTGKLIKKAGVPVYYSIIRGGYLTSPKYNLRDRLGKVEVEINQLFAVDDLSKLSPQEIEDIINKSIYHDDYEWNKTAQNHYGIGENGAEDLETLLFWCPKCGKQHVMETEGNKIYCNVCGNGATLTDTYELVPFDDSCEIPETQTKWFNMQRDVIKKEVASKNFVLKEKVKLGTLPNYKLLIGDATSQMVGEGQLILDHSGLSYEGTRDGKPWNFHIEIKNLPTYGMCTDVSRFYTFVDGEFVEFYPENKVVEKFFIATEEIHRLKGGKWQDFNF